MKEILKKVKECRAELNKDRKSFWEKNKRNFKNNIRSVSNFYGLPSKWKVHLVASRFVSTGDIPPYGRDSWSAVNLISASKNQGYEAMLFINRARAEFLSLPGLMPLVAHELGHVEQAARQPRKYIHGAIDDNISQELEADAEKRVRALPEKARKEYVLESILYCYDFYGWTGARKMADFLYGRDEDLRDKGYDRWMTEEEYNMFSRAEKEEDVDVVFGF